MTPTRSAWPTQSGARLRSAGLAAGGKVSRDAGPVKGGTSHIAFVDDPTGYKWELIQRSGPIPEPIAQARLGNSVPGLSSARISCHAGHDPRP